MAKRQIVFLMTDTTRFDMLGAYGNKDMKTPNLDKLASEGMAVTFISSETDEMIRTCSRMIVLRDRKVVGELSQDEISQSKIMSTIAGGDR